MNIFKCDQCGRFISYEDLRSGRAKNVMVLPESEYSQETWETLCPEHNDDRWHNAD